MSLYVLTLSVHSPDQYRGWVAQGEQRQDLALNDTETLPEPVLEDCLDLEDPIPEPDEPEEEVEQTLLEKDYVFTPSFSLHTPTFPGLPLLTTLIPFQPAFVAGLVSDINSPPPQRQAC
ncbi:hypothetical protein [Spirosoma utsteinense]|uniref:Uncharacterized protein n=1 Tax=Spirosoma utsteinense TaxID=2585773 RepID=A0ABR6WBP8_9BACT|nr:hypothetical protein [Spirosoma utsteinense]MBC3787042.1 hypothetical protein [Spirosoma utsteinense]MBC3793377.1 hypothetical protein [Spirosoma utsteinense]